MTWIKLYDNTPRHPKVSGLSDKAFRVWITSLCYCSEFLTDGALPACFLSGVRRSVQDELITAQLWDRQSDHSLLVHEYTDYQTSRAIIECERESARRRRGVSPERRPNVARTSPEHHPNVGDQKQKQKQKIDVEGERAAAPLIMSPLHYERRKAVCAYVGARLEVPNLLHGELRKNLGGVNAEADLLTWYADVDAEIEASGEPIIPDVFRWLKARFAGWAKKSASNAKLDQAMRELEAEGYK